MKSAALRPCQHKPALPALCRALRFPLIMPEPSSKLPQFYVVGFSGHRQLKDHEAVAAAIRQALAALQHEAPGHWIALSSVAAGSDAQFVREAFQAGLAWHAVLPLPAAEF